eukprot:1366039-Pleurochrysis_carterae.AAC.1
MIDLAGSERQARTPNALGGLLSFALSRDKHRLVGSIASANRAVTPFPPFLACPLSFFSSFKPYSPILPFPTHPVLPTSTSSACAVPTSTSSACALPTSSSSACALPT